MTDKTTLARAARCRSSPSNGTKTEQVIEQRHGILFYQSAFPVAVFDLPGALRSPHSRARPGPPHHMPKFEKISSPFFLQPSRKLKKLSSEHTPPRLPAPSAAPLATRVCANSLALECPRA